MAFLIQGDNKPIIIEIDEPVSNIEQFSAVLYWKSEEYKRWTEKEIIAEDCSIKLPLTQAESMEISSESVNLEIKMMANGDIEFFEVVKLDVQRRRDHAIFKAGDES